MPARRTSERERLIADDAFGPAGRGHEREAVVDRETDHSLRDRERGVVTEGERERRVSDNDRADPGRASLVDRKPHRSNAEDGTPLISAGDRGERCRVALDDVLAPRRCAPRADAVSNDPEAQRSLLGDTPKVRPDHDVGEDRGVVFPHADPLEDRCGESPEIIGAHDVLAHVSR
jgi:hypothetical protein